MNKKFLCERKQCCAKFAWVVTHEKHENKKGFYENCKQNIKYVNCAI